MKTKFLTKISTFIILFVMCITSLVGCATPLKMPATSDDVTGNGGLAVQKGEYLYFVNGYTSKSSMSSGDNKGSFNYSSIYRAKLNQNNQLEYDEDGKIVDCKKLVSKVAGFDNTALYIFGDYLYFASPYADTVANNGHQENNFKLTDFYRIKLDGTGLKTIYTTNNDSENLQFGFYKTKNSDDVNLVVYDSTKLVVVNCSTNSAKVVSENVTAVALPKVTDYKHDNNNITKQESAVYYTRSGTEEENLSAGNVLAYSVIGENTENTILSGTNTYTIKSANKDALVVSFKETDDANECNYFITFDSEGVPQNDLNEIKNQALDSSGNSNVYLCAFEDGNPVGMITTNAKNKLVMLDYTNNNEAKVLNYTLALTPLCISGNYVYAYDENKSLYRINYKQALVAQDKASCTQKIYDSEKVIEDAEEEKTADDIYFDAKTNFSVVGNYVYFYMPYVGEEETGYYLNRINMLTEELSTELVGEIQSEHIVVETEEN